jgi:hypothetical protein
MDHLILGTNATKALPFRHNASLRIEVWLRQSAQKRRATLRGVLSQSMNLRG